MITIVPVVNPNSTPSPDRNDNTGAWVSVTGIN